MTDSQKWMLTAAVFVALAIVFLMIDVATHV